MNLFPEQPKRGYFILTIHTKLVIKFIKCAF